MNKILGSYIVALLLIYFYFLAINNARADTLTLALDELCDSGNGSLYTKQLCIEPLHNKAQLVERKFTSAAAKVDGFDRLKELYNITSYAKVQIKLCAMRGVSEYVSCVDKVLNEAKNTAEDKYSVARTTDFEHYNATENIRAAALNYADIVLDKKLNELKSCRVEAANKLDDNISAAADIASAVQAKCRVIVNDYYDLYFIHAEPKELFDIFYFDSMTSAISFEQTLKIKQEAIERWFGQQTTIALVLEQRANRRAAETQNTKPIKPKNNTKKVQS